MRSGGPHFSPTLQNPNMPWSDQMDRLRASCARTFSKKDSAVYQQKNGQNFPIQAILGRPQMLDDVNPGAYTGISIDLAEFQTAVPGELPKRGDTILIGTSEQKTYTVFSVQVDPEDMVHLACNAA